jgi:hypothetical protein
MKRVFRHAGDMAGFKKVILGRPLELTLKQAIGRVK